MEEKLDENAQKILELSAIVHDISCPLCREKYGNTDGKKQEMESPPLVKAFLADYLVNAGENHYLEKSVYEAENQIFRTNTGKRLLGSMYHRAFLPEGNPEI